MAEHACDVAIIGGGTIGCAIALELAGRGAAVTIIERDTPGRAATFAAAGMLLPLGEAQAPGPFLQLALASMARWPDLAVQLAEATGIDVEYRASGKLFVALSEADARDLEAQHAWQVADRFNEVQLLSGDEARRLEPAVTARAVAGLFTPYDHQVNNRLLGQALPRAAVAAGAQLLTGASARALLGDRGRTTGVLLTDGRIVPAANVVIAGGAWSAQLEGLPRPLPVFPVRGQMAALQCAPPPLTHLVMTHGCYLVARAGTHMLIGATVEQRGFRNHTTPAGIRALLDAVIEVLPASAEMPIDEIWSGLRPGTPDELPILGTDPDLAGLFYATGHYRNGILLTPITARIIADMVQDVASEIDARAFDIMRFGEPVDETAHPRCERCGAAMYESHCKIVCPRCGYQRDCSDP